MNEKYLDWLRFIIESTEEGRPFMVPEVTQNLVWSLGGRAPVFDMPPEQVVLYLFALMHTQLEGRP